MGLPEDPLLGVGCSCVYWIDHVRAKQVGRFRLSVIYPDSLYQEPESISGRNRYILNKAEQISNSFINSTEN